MLILTTKGLIVKRFIFELQVVFKFLEIISFQVLRNNKLVLAQFKLVYAQTIEVLSNQAQQPMELEHCDGGGGAGQTNT